MIEEITEVASSQDEEIPGIEDEDVISLFRRYHKTKIFDEVTGKIKSSDKKIRNELVNRNARLVTFVVNKFYNKLEYRDIREDLIQEGFIGLFTAIDKFDPERGFKFSTYAVHWVQQACSGFLLESRPHLHIPSHIRTAQNKLLKFLRENKKSMKDIDSKTMEELGLTEKLMGCINSALASKQVHYLSEPVSASAETTIGELIEGKESSSEEKTELNGVVELAKNALLSLSPRERLLILLRYNIIQSV